MMGYDISIHNATKLAPNQLAAIVALVGGSSVTDAAERVGIDRTTLHRWLSGDAAFLAALNRMKMEALDAIRREVRSAVGDAARVVRELVTNPDTPPAIRLRDRPRTSPHYDSWPSWEVTLPQQRLNV